MKFIIFNGTLKPDAESNTFCSVQDGTVSI